VIHRLTQKAALRARSHGLRAGALDLDLRFVNKFRWSDSVAFLETSDTLFLTKVIKALWKSRPYQNIPIQKANIVLKNLIADKNFTPSLFNEECNNRDTLNKTMDKITNKFGKKSLYLGGAHEAMETAQPKIAFQHIPDIKLEE